MEERQFDIRDLEDLKPFDLTKLDALIREHVEARARTGTTLFVRDSDSAVFVLAQLGYSEIPAPHQLPFTVKAAPSIPQNVGYMHWDFPDKVEVWQVGAPVKYVLKRDFGNSLLGQLLDGAELGRTLLFQPGPGTLQQFKWPAGGVV